MRPLLVLATRNAHKAREVQQILADRFRIMSLADFPGAPSTLEDQDSFAGNATKKALELANWLSQTRSTAHDPNPIAFVAADDSGLEVDAVGGAPGVHSARYTFLGTDKTGNAPDAENNAKLLRMLDGIPTERRTARFRCVIALVGLEARALTASKVEIFEGTCEGRIGFGGRGAAGFGYDPLFVPEGLSMTFAEISDEVKNQISHRAKALRQMCERLRFN